MNKIVVLVSLGDYVIFFRKLADNIGLLQDVFRGITSKNTKSYEAEAVNGGILGNSFSYLQKEKRKKEPCKLLRTDALF